MDVCLVIKQRLEGLGIEQRELAAAAEVTESYISQLLTRKKLPPTPERTDIYAKMERFLKLPVGKLSKLADDQRREELKRHLGDQPAPLLRDVRELILRKCVPDKEKEVRAIFEKQPFGELERLVTQKLLDVVKGIAKEELESETWLHLVARLVGRNYEQMRVIVLEFLDADLFSLSVENCDSFLDPLIESWDIDLSSFAMQVALNRRLAPGYPKKFEFMEKQSDSPHEEEPGLKRFLRDPSLSGGASEKEIEFLKKLRLEGRKPNALYFYRELQNLRDPLHFSEDSAAPMRKRVDQQTQAAAGKNGRSAPARKRNQPKRQSKAKLTQSHT